MSRPFCLQMDRLCFLQSDSGHLNQDFEARSSLCWGVLITFFFLLESNWRLWRWVKFGSARIFVSIGIFASRHISKYPASYLGFPAHIFHHLSCTLSSPSLFIFFLFFTVTVCFTRTQLSSLSLSFYFPFFLLFH